MLIRPINLFSVINQKGIQYNVRVVFPGDCYGREFQVIHANADPLIEFYNSQGIHKDDPYGWYISRYFWTTLQENLKKKQGVLLDGAYQNLDVDDEAMVRLLSLIELFIERWKNGR